MTNMITLNEIENKIVLILMASPNIMYTQYTLYDKILEKFDVKDYKADQGFKAKYMLVLNNLDKTYDNIKLQNINDKYIICYEDKDEIKSNQNKEEIINDLNNSRDDDMSNSSFILDFIVTNKVTDHYNYIDPKTGNTILHEVLSKDNTENVKNILQHNSNLRASNERSVLEAPKSPETERIVVDGDLLILNKNLETPIEKINSIQVSNLIIMELLKKINNYEEMLLNSSIRIDMLNDSIKKNNVKDLINDYSIFELIYMKITLFFSSIYKMLIILFLIMMIIKYYKLKFF